ncbi:MAG: DUF349 domain-containing protein [Paludibacter sp.]|nr:DUF349 domain-containing protein [Paludibacter sp.]
MSSLDVNKENENLALDEIAEVIDATTLDSTVSNIAVVEVEIPKTELKPDFSTQTRAELVESLKNLVNDKVEAIKDDVESIKLHFYKKLKSEVEEHKKVESEGEELELAPVKDQLEEELKVLLNDYKARKAALVAKLEQEKEQNLLEKQAILEQMKQYVDGYDDVSSHINDFKALQAKWKLIGQVPAKDLASTLKLYSNHQEKFWDLIKINNELREYDFKKNLEAKTHICESAERLAELSDVVSAFQQLQKFHADWHDLGPVSREFRDSIWNRFKEASSVINKKHQAFFDELRQKEDQFQQAKTELCEKIEAFDYTSLNNYKAWDDATQTVLAWQEEWRSLGFAPRKVNQQLFDRYRAGCDAFFAAKNEFYKASKAVLNQNLEKKKALCAQAEALKDSTDWKETADKLIQLQKEWKTVGPIAKKISDELWKQFVTACDFFFEQKNKNFSSQKSVETENLQKKKDIVAKIQAISVEGNTSDTVGVIKALMAEYAAVGHVPFKEKDKIYTEYRAAVDEKFGKLNVDSSQRKLDNFKSNLKDMSNKGENKLYREREKLMRSYEQLKSEIATYENNIGFFTSSSQKGGGLIKEMERKIEALKADSKLIEEKIALIDQSI